MDHRAYTPVFRSEITEGLIVGVPIYGLHEEMIGCITHAQGDPKITEIVVDVECISGIKLVMLFIDQITLMRNEDRDVFGVTRWNRDKITSLPTHRF